MKQRVLLMSSVHPATDPRLVYKIAPSLAQHYEVFCVVPNALSQQADITFLSVPHFTRLFWRLLISHPALLWHCIRVRPALVHIFVPELIPVALLLHWLGALVVYEVQENLYQKFSIKKYNNAWLYRSLFRYFDHLARRYFHLIFTDEGYLKEYSQLRHPHVVVRNFVYQDFMENGFYKKNERPEFLYLGTISIERGLDVMIAAFAKLITICPDFHVHLFGINRVEKHVMESLKGYETACRHMTFYGYTDQHEISRKIGKPTAAIALLKPVADYPESYTTKLFEYMSMGIPVITSDFPLYKAVVEHSACGFCISPYSAEQLYETLAWVLSNPEECLEMGENGKKSARQHYNWNSESDKLLSFYKSIVVS